MKNFLPTYRALDGYDVEKLYVEQESLEARGLTEADLLVPVEVLSSAEMGELMAEQDVVLVLLRRSAMLHIVNKSHAQTSALQSCLRLARPGHALLLIEDAVYAATAGGAASAERGRGADER